MNQNTKEKKPLNLGNISIMTWLLVVAALAYMLFNLFSYEVVTGAMKYVMAGIAVIMSVAFLVVTLKKKNGLSCFLNVVLCAALVFAGFVIPSQQKQQENLFKEPAKSDVMYVDFFVLNDGNHTSDQLEDYGDAKFIVQKQLDTVNEYTAVAEAGSVIGSDINTVEYDTILDSLKALYSGKGDVLILNRAFVAKIKTIDAYKNFTSDTKVIHTVQIGEEKQEEVIDDNDGKEPFVVLITGSDTRDSALTVVTRTDVDMIMAVNPQNRQIVFVSIPRDYYVYNPGLEGMDKLTHLGNLGVTNTVAGINQQFGLNIESYLCTNFTHFKQMIDGLGGITIDNPDTFTTINGGPGYYFEAGTVTLDGEHALAYARERYALPNGDFDRSRHETIIMQGMMQKIQQLVKEGQKTSVLKTLSSNFLTNMNFNDLYNLYTSSSDVDQEWEYIRYGLDGMGTYAGTVSMGWDTMLYVCQPIDAQVAFVSDLVNKVLNGEVVGQEVMPGQEGATYVETDETE